MLSDLRESGSLEQDSDLVVLVHRPDMYDKESERAGEADLDVAKHRNGPTRTVTVASRGTTAGSPTWRGPFDEHVAARPRHRAEWGPAALAWTAP